MVTSFSEKCAVSVSRWSEYVGLRSSTLRITGNYIPATQRHMLEDSKLLSQKQREVSSESHCLICTVLGTVAQC